MNRIGLKRLRRKRKLDGRVRCHGNKLGCLIEHARRMAPRQQAKAEDYTETLRKIQVNSGRRDARTAQPAAWKNIFKRFFRKRYGNSQ